MKSETSVYTGFKFEAEGHMAMAIINTALKSFPEKHMYAHSVFVMLVPDTYLENGHPDEEEYDELNKIEKQLIEYLEEQTRTVHVGHITLYRRREVVFYTADPEQVESFLEHFLKDCGRAFDWEIDEDEEWNNVAPFYDLL